MVTSIKQLGFECTQQSKTNKMFAMLEFKMSQREPEEGVHIEAKPCLYKRR